jgi:hypothetical protein
MKKRKMNNHTTFFVLLHRVLAHIYVRVHLTEWEGRQRIPIVGSRMEKRSKHAHSLKKNAEEKTKDERSGTHQVMAQTFCIIILLLTSFIQKLIDSNLFKRLSRKIDNIDNND